MNQYRDLAISRLSIGVLSKRTGCKIETIRYYERIGFLPAPPRTERGHRLIETGTCAHPDGKLPIDLRSTFVNHRKQMGEAVRTMISWTPNALLSRMPLV